MSEEQLKDLINRRGQVKGKLTRFSKFLIVDSNRNKITELTTRLERAEGYLHTFEDLQNQIELLDISGVDQSLEREEFEDIYFAETAKAKDIIKIYNLSKTPVNGEELPRTDVSILENNTNVKLPQLTIPQFNGAYDKWTQYYDSFRSLIHENTQLSNVQKFYYLKSSLKDDAARVIESLEITDANYMIALNLLKERFENKKFIIKTHIKGLVELANVTKESHFLLRNLLDSFQKHFRALRNLNEPVEQWSTILIYLIGTKLDTTSRKEWEIKTHNKISPTIEEFITFLRDRCQLLESIDKGVHNPSLNKHENKSHVHVSLNNYSKCLCCKGEHPLYYCKEFLQLSPSARYDMVRKNKKTCFNCLRVGHTIEKCTSSYSCRKCKKRHNSLLHVDNNLNEAKNLQLCKSADSQTDQTTSNSSTSQTDEGVIVTHSKNTNFAVLSTALVYIYDNEQNPIKCRALLDSGSQSNFITDELFEKLCLPATQIDLPVSGISSSNIRVNKMTQATIKSVNFNHQFNLSFLVISRITGNIPQRSFDCSELNMPKTLVLADTTFNKSGNVDMLLGVNIFYELLLNGQIKLGLNKPILQKSKLGWIIAGPLDTNTFARSTLCNVTQISSLENQLEAFWRIEECSTKDIIHTKEEIACETHFCDNYYRDHTGKFVVKLPFRDNLEQLGDTLSLAIKRFYALERKFSRNAEFQQQYCKFMSEYIQLGHMTPIENCQGTSKPAYYLPHHAVVKETSLTTKLRVVFDASARPERGLSLNETLMVGPTIQQDIFSILLRFRVHEIVFTADVEKMYRCVKVHEQDRSFQRIVWRADTNQALKHYNMNTVTYGTASASFLATRCLKQLAIENEERFPEASKVISHDFYMDDLISGSGDIDSAISLINNVTDILDAAGFNLRQWASNRAHLLNQEIQNRGDSAEFVLKDMQHSNKTLGILWSSSKDCFQYKTAASDQTNFTKRKILSVISQVFDPLGLIGPVTVKAKMILQKLWQLKISWDQEITGDLLTEWNQFYQGLGALNQFDIPRQMVISERDSFEIHAFSDASERAYGACVYVRSTDARKNTVVRLACAKSRVAPLKPLTLPRLELCAAVLAVQLVNKVLESVRVRVVNKKYWCDSKIVLSWIAMEPCRLKTFVCNRIAKIQHHTDESQWTHVPSQTNPADILSRGSDPDQLMQTSMWLNGPDWLWLDTESWPMSTVKSGSEFEIPECRVVVSLSCVQNDTVCEEIISKYSSYTKLLRVVAYILRFKNNTRSTSDQRKLGDLSVDEIDNSIRTIVRVIQTNSFKSEFERLKMSKTVHRKSRLSSLDPFLDTHNIIRVGGRLQNANLAFDNKHPMVLPTKHHFTDLLIKYEHYRNLHAGVQLVLASVRNKFWLLSGRREIRRVLRKCIVCFRVNPPNIIQKMGNLPVSRVNPSRPFSSCGVDYAGPFQLKDSKLRNRKFIKAYTCIFICFSTKAMHLELVTDLSTEGFLNTFKRFTARRGLCSHIFSDNATNFVGAEKILNKFKTIIQDEQIQTYLVENKIIWHFIPPSSPHIGGLWESAVKLTKYHLKRVIGDTKFTFEQFYTILVQVESIVNSRPLTPLTDDPNDLQPLTPGHFLIGGPVRMIPEVPVADNRTYTSKYKHAQSMLQQFWTRWSTDYVHTLQQRSKWRFKCKEELLEGALVILREDHLPAPLWKMGRIVETHPGSDGIVRVVTVRTNAGVFKRAVNKICLVPIEDH